MGFIKWGACLLAVALAGCTEGPRYQISGIPGGAWKVDTKTGDVWLCIAGDPPKCRQAAPH